MTFEPVLRPIQPDEYAGAEQVFLQAFGMARSEDMSARTQRVLEIDRTVAAFDGTDVVATAGSYTFEMSVPSYGEAGMVGSVPMAGVTWVSVLPTHRRRGLLTRLMRRQLDDIHEAGREAVATLWASEAPIYGRFGYGPATTVCSATVPRRANRLLPVAGTGDVRLRTVDGAEHLDATTRVYDAVRARRPGMIGLPDAWRDRGLIFPEHSRRGATPLRTLLAEGADGEVRGYAHYAIRGGHDFGAATTVVRELFATDPAAMSALLGLLLDHDLTAETSLWLRPPDDPAFQLLLDSRPASVTCIDGLDVRLVDVGRALAARTYAVPVDTVIEVADGFCPWNAGRWHLAGDPTGATCDTTTDPADLTLDVRELGSVYLGGPTLLALADAGLVTEHTPGAIRTLSLALRSDPAPWSTFIF